MNQEITSIKDNVMNHESSELMKAIMLTPNDLKEKIMEKKFYVTMTDKFMSGWGKAENLKNKLVFVCDNLEEAGRVYENAVNREEMKYINICLTRPFYYRATEGADYQCNGYLVQIKTKEDYPSFYMERNKNEY